MDNFRIVDLPALNGIRLGNLFIKPHDAEKITSRMVRPLASEYVEGEPILGLIGSSTLLRAKDQLFAACTRHQLQLQTTAKFDESHVAHIRVTSYEKNTLTNIPLDGVQFVADNLDEAFSDLLLFRVAADWDALNQERVYFTLLRKPLSKKRTKSWIVGFPSNQNHLDMDAKNYSSVCRVVGCQYDPSYRTNNRHFRRFKLDRLEKNLDGYSGGAVFTLFGETGAHEIIFDGLIIRGGENYVYAIAPEIISRLANEFRPNEIRAERKAQIG